METVDDNLEMEAVSFIRCSEEHVLEEYGLNVLPSLVYFERGVPKVYHGDLKNDDTILGWVTKELEEEGFPEIEKEDILDSLLNRLEFVAVVYYQKLAAEDKAILDKLEASIGNEAKLHDINIVLVSDQRLLSKLGVEDSPVVVYYENNVPFLYKRSLKQGSGASKALMKWLIEQRNSASIEEITDDMLEEVIEENPFVAVLFTGLCADEDEEEECKKVRESLESIDHVLDSHGIVLVMTSELDRAREYWISKFPAIAYFRNGDYLKFPGNVTNAKGVLKWLTSEKAINVPNKIISVNDLMLTKMLKRGKSLFVFFYESGDIFSEKILRGLLEDLEDQLNEDNTKADFVKISEEGIAADYDLDGLPALVHFWADKSKVFYGDIRDEEAVAQWVTEESGELSTNIVHY